MIVSTAKAQACFRDLADRLSKRISASASINTVRAANDANGWPMLFLSVAGNEAEAQPVIVLRMSAVSAVSLDVFGNPLSAYAPHIIEVAYEMAAANKPEPSILDLQTVEYEAFKIGARTQVKQIANGTAVTETSMNAKAADLDVDDLYWPTKSV